MTTPALPNNGDSNWGTELNSYLSNVIKAEADQTATAFSGHAAGIAPGQTATGIDPHGDQAYARQLFAPVTQNVNSANGFVQLDGSGHLPSKDPWHDFRPVSGNFGTGSYYPPQYRITLDGEVKFAGYVYTTSAAYNGIAVFTTLLAAPYLPNKPVQRPVTVNAAGTAGSFQPPMLVVGTDGSVQLQGLPAGIPSGTAIGIYCDYPSDSYNSLIQS